MRNVFSSLRLEAFAVNSCAVFGLVVFFTRVCDWLLCFTMGTPCSRRWHYATKISQICNSIHSAMSLGGAGSWGELGSSSGQEARSRGCWNGRSRQARVSTQTREIFNDAGLRPPPPPPLLLLLLLLLHDVGTPPVSVGACPDFLSSCPVYVLLPFPSNTPV